jgi:hypothetical protein
MYIYIFFAISAFNLSHNRWREKIAGKQDEEMEIQKK